MDNLRRTIAASKEYYNRFIKHTYFRYLFTTKSDFIMAAVQ